MTKNEIREIGTKIDFAVEGILDTEFLQNLKKELSEADLTFWHNNPPEFIVLATASLRKSYLAYLGSYKFDFSQVPKFVEGMSVASGFNVSATKPLDFQRTVEAEIRNGDGTIKPGTMLFLGYLHGVPVIVDPQTGETSENDDALSQSRCKIDSVMHLPRYENTDTLFISSDTVGWVETPNKHGVSLGKPRNHEFYPKKKEFENDVAYDERKQAFMFWYLMAHFTSINLSSYSTYSDKFDNDFDFWYQIVGETLESAKDWVLQVVVDHIKSEVELETVSDLHKNALLLVRGGVERVVETTLHHEMGGDRQLIMMLLAVNGEPFFSESAGAGVIQKEVFRERYESEDDYLVTDDQMRKFLESISPELRSWHLLLHLMGVPVWAMALLQEMCNKNN